MGDPFRDKHRGLLPDVDVTPVDEGNIPQPPSRPGVILLIIAAAIAALGLLVLVAAT